LVFFIMKAEAKAQVEAEISDTITELERAQVGRAPQQVKSYIIEDMVVIRLKGILTPIEQELSKHPEGSDLIKRCRVCLVEKAQNIFKEIIRNLLNVEVIAFYADISTEINEGTIIFTLRENVEPKFKEKKRRLKHIE